MKRTPELQKLIDAAPEWVKRDFALLAAEHDALLEGDLIKAAIAKKQRNDALDEILGIS